MITDGLIEAHVNHISRYMQVMDVSKLSDQLLIEQFDFMKWSKDCKDNRLRDKKKRHKEFKFDNPQFEELLTQIKTELDKRGIRYVA